MSFGYAVPRQTTSKLLVTPPPYVRPSEWVALTPVGATEQKFTGVYAVYPNNEDNYVALTATVSTGNYTIDWGDGTSENIASGTQANHQYTYASVGDLTSYGYKQVTITVTPQTANLLTITIRNRPNYSGVSTTNTWVSKWLDIEVGSPNLTGVIIGANNNTISLPLLQRFRWVSKSASYVNQDGFFYWCVALRSVIFDCDMSNWNTMNTMFYNCSSLLYAPYFDTSSVTTMQQTFTNCYNLISVPAYKTPVNTSLNSTFLNCFKLKYLGGFTSTANVTDLGSAFRSCVSLTSIQPLNLPSAVNLNQSFQSATGLVSISISNINNCTSFTSSFSGAVLLKTVNISGNFTGAAVTMAATFNGCNNLSEFNFPNTANVTSLSQTFLNCSSLLTIPITHTPKVTNLTSAFQNCLLIQTIPNLSTSNCTNFSSTFQGLPLIQDAPNLNTASATTVASMFNSCLNLRSLPAYNLSTVGTGQALILGAAGNTIGTSSPITTSDVYGVRFSISYSQCGLSTSSLNTMMGNLGSVGAASQILTITGNPGADTALTKSATWTNTSNVMTMANTVGVIVGAQVSNTTNVNLGYTGTLTSNKVSVDSVIDANTIISFTTVTTSNALANTLYYTSNIAGTGPYTYDISTTQGGTPNTFTNGTANMRVNLLVTTVNTNANVVLNAYPAGNGTTSNVTTRTLNTNFAAYKGWTVTG